MTSRFLAAAFALAFAFFASTATAQDAASLLARHASLQGRLATNQFGRPLVLESNEASGELKGDVYTVVDHPYATVQAALQSRAHWCDILILHLNVKRCRVGSTADKGLMLSVGRKFDQPVEDTYSIDFAWKTVAATADYLNVQLSADEGPLSTKNYRIRIEAIPLDASHSFIHMAYSYGYGFSAKLAMQSYLATIGRDKVGFTITGKKGDGKPEYLGGTLGLLERNTMRYYLAIDAYLAAYALPAGEQVERRMKEWYGSTERYATQLHEMERNEYLEMKRKEIARQGAQAPT